MQVREERTWPVVGWIGDTMVRSRWRGDAWAWPRTWERLWPRSPLPRSGPKALTVFFRQEAGSTCSSSVSDVLSDSEELLLESLPSSEDEPSPCPSATFFLFLVFLFPPSSSLCSLEERRGGK